MNFSRTLYLSAAVLAAVTPSLANACPVSPSDGILWDTDLSRDQADVVALVTVASWTSLEPFGAKAELIVEHVWKGEVGPRWTMTQDLSTDCDYALQRNVRYVIFAKRRDSGKFSITAVADGALGIVSDRLDGKTMEPPRMTSGR